jgi:hypothetical protein
VEPATRTRALWIVAGVSVLALVGISDASCAAWAHAVVYALGSVAGVALGLLAALALRGRILALPAFLVACAGGLAFAWLLVKTCGFAG